MVCMHHRAERGVAAPLKEEQDAVLSSLPEDIPKPVIKIDNQHDPFATIVTIEYGDRLGELLDTVSLSAFLLFCAVLPLTSCTILLPIAVSVSHIKKLLYPVQTRRGLQLQLPGTFLRQVMTA